MRLTQMVVSLLLATAVFSAELSAQIITDNEVVAVVNKTVITRYDVMESFRKEEVDLSKMSRAEQELQFARRLKDMVRKSVRDEAAEKSGVNVSPEELENRKIKEIERMGGEAAFESFLRERGQSMDDYDQEFRRSQEQATWLRVVSGRGGARLSRDLRPLYDITVRPSELRSIYKRELKTKWTTKNEASIRVIQVYFRRNARGERRAKKRELQGVRQKLKTKADFAVLAKRHSDHSTKDEGGLIRSLEKGKGAVVPEPIEEAIFGKDAVPGTIIGPIEHINSYWLVKVESKKEARVIPFAEAQAQIRNIRMRQKIYRAITEVELDLLKNSYVYPPALKRIITRDLEALMNQAR